MVYTYLFYPIYLSLIDYVRDVILTLFKMEQNRITGAPTYYEKEIEL